MNATLKKVIEIVVHSEVNLEVEHVDGDNVIHKIAKENDL